MPVGMENIVKIFSAKDSV